MTSPWAAPQADPTGTPPAPPPTALRPSRAAVVASWLEGRNRHTYASFKVAADKWTTWCDRNDVDALDPTIGQCRQYLQVLMGETSSNATVRARCQALRLLIDHAVKQCGYPQAVNQWREVKLPVPPRESTTPSLEDDQHAQLLTWCASKAADRTNALIRLLSIEALRRDAARLFRLDDLTVTTAGWRYRYRGKGDVEHVIHVDDETVDAIQATAAGRTSGWLFTGRKDGPLSERAIADLVRAACLGAGVPAVPPHGLRKTGITRAIDTVGLSGAQSLAGHARPDTTARYYDGRTDRQQHAVEAVVAATREKEPTDGR